MKKILKKRVKEYKKELSLKKWMLI
jgi:hypothetical protein